SRRAPDPPRPDRAPEPPPARRTAPASARSVAGISLAELSLGRSGDTRPTGVRTATVSVTNESQQPAPDEVQAGPPPVAAAPAERPAGWSRGGRAGLRRSVSSLRHRNYRLFFFGQLISVMGTWMQTVAQSFLVLDLTHSGPDLGLAPAARFLPILIFGPAGGLVADRP